MYKITFIAAVLSSMIIVACGGGSGGDAATTPVVAIDEVLIDLTATVGTPASASASTLCGYDVGPNLIEGLVTGVHDGDTVTVNGVNIRLDSIDAPELAQTYGAQSQASLSRLVMGQSVKVAYTKSDRYGRIVGAVFTGACQYANLEQVQSGSAWFYRAYQCEISAPARTLFDQAEAAARAARSGLWSEASPSAPWFYRNGNAPAIPTCELAAPTWAGNPTTTPPVATSPICYQVWVNGYTKANGTVVSGYYRNSPACP
jgi:endonuclease YncB( thermonuclease family)